MGFCFVTERMADDFKDHIGYDWMASVSAMVDLTSECDGMRFVETLVPIVRGGPQGFKPHIHSDKKGTSFPASDMVVFTSDVHFYVASDINSLHTVKSILIQKYKIPMGFCFCLHQLTKGLAFWDGRDEPLDLRNPNDSFPHSVFSGRMVFHYGMSYCKNPSGIL